MSAEIPLDLDRPAADSIPLDHPIIDRVKTLIPAEFHAQTWIAGSAAARWPEAFDKGGDVDVWVCGLRWRERGRLSELLGRVGLGDDDLLYEHDELIGSSIQYSSDRLQVMLSEYAMSELLSNFDISCHTAAISLTGGGVLAPALTSNVRILNWHNPRRTLERGAKFSRRYRDHSFWRDDRTIQCALAALMIPSDISRQELVDLMSVRVGPGL